MVFNVLEAILSILKDFFGAILTVFTDVTTLIMLVSNEFCLSTDSIISYIVIIAFAYLLPS